MGTVCSIQLLQKGNSSEGESTDPEWEEFVSRVLHSANRYCSGSWSRFDPTTQTLLFLAYSILIVFGAVGNGLVCYAVLANAHMRTPRNLLIFNLAASDLILCCFTQPFNLLKVSMINWKLGAFMCKLIPTAAGTNVFVSTISITAIALDRFKLIVRPTIKDILLSRQWIAIVMLSIWGMAILLASPMLVFTTIEYIGIPQDNPIFSIQEICVEKLEYSNWRITYSFASMLIQYILPIVVVSVAHARICRQLRSRMSRLPATQAEKGSVKSKNRADRERKTNRLLVMIAVVFAASYMPLYIFNIIYDLDLKKSPSLLAFAICHLLVLCSACVNPVLYGWLNENFHQEFLRVLCGRCRHGSAIKSSTAAPVNPTNAINSQTRLRETKETKKNVRLLSTPCPEVKAPEFDPSSDGGVYVGEHSNREIQQQPIDHATSVHDMCEAKFKSIGAGNWLSVAKTSCDVSNLDSVDADNTLLDDHDETPLHVDNLPVKCKIVDSGPVSFDAAVTNDVRAVQNSNDLAKYKVDDTLNYSNANQFRPKENSLGGEKKVLVNASLTHLDSTQIVDV